MGSSKKLSNFKYHNYHSFLSKMNFPVFILKTSGQRFLIDSSYSARSPKGIFFYYCLFSCPETWELVNLFVKTKNFSYHICYENIAKYSRVKRQTGHGQTEPYASKEDCIVNETFKDWRKIKSTVYQNQMTFKTCW